MLRAPRRRVPPHLPRAPSALRPLLVVAFLLAVPACVSTKVSAQLGYMSADVAGDLSLAEGSNSAEPRQDIGSAFGLGSNQPSVFGRVDVDMGVPEFTASLFWLRDSGSGALDESFGGLPAGTQVSSDLDLGCAKLVAAAGFELGPVHVAPGMLFDVFSIDFRATASQFGGREEVDEVVMVPMPFLRAESTFAGVRVAGEVAWLDTAGLTDVEGRFFDVEATIEWPMWSRFSLVTGYRTIRADVDADSDADNIGIDLQVRGWFVGGGLRF
jgi:hypothetical protein